MQIEATGKPLRYKLRSGEEVLLEPGCPVELPDESARSLLKQAGERVRIVPSDAEPVIHPGAWVSWQRGDGTPFGSSSAPGGGREKRLGIG